MEVNKKLDSSKPLTVIFTWNTTTQQFFERLWVRPLTPNPSNIVPRKINFFAPVLLEIIHYLGWEREG